MPHTGCIDKRKPKILVTDDEQGLRDITERGCDVVTVESSRREAQAQAALNAVLRISLEPLPLNDMLDRILERVLSVKWLSIEAKGSIFLVQPSSQALAMAVQYGLNDELRKRCALVPFGSCLCGLAAATGELVFSSHLDDRHTQRFAGGSEHGHYCLPIKSGAETLGVLNLYIKEGHARDENEISFLEALIDVIAGIIKRSRAERSVRLLGRMAREVGAAADTAAALQSVLHSVALFGGWALGEAWLPSPDGSHLELAETWHQPSPQLEKFKAASEAFQFAANESAQGRIWASGKQAWIEDFPVDSDFPRAALAREAGLCTLLVAPVFADGEVIAVVTLFMREAKSEDKELMGFVAAAVAQIGPVLRRRRAEDSLRAKEAQLLQTQKMEAVGQLAAGVAHEINNPLGVILGFAQSLARRLKEDDPFGLPIKSIEREALRCKSLVQDLLVFSRQSSSRVEDVHLSVAVGRALRLVATQSRVNAVEIEQHLEPCTVRGNSNQIEQIVVNLSGNALDAMPKGGKLTVRTRLSKSKHGYAVIEVKDSGDGIPAEVRSKIFDAFFTTKDIGKGTGLGLALVHKIVTDHGGSIELDSEVGQGTTFTVRLPVKQESRS